VKQKFITSLYYQHSIAISEMDNQKIVSFSLILLLAGAAEVIAAFLL
jgi:hypothetical protein